MERVILCRIIVTVDSCERGELLRVSKALLYKFSETFITVELNSISSERLNIHSLENENDIDFDKILIEFW